MYSLNKIVFLYDNKTNQNVIWPGSMLRKLQSNELTTTEFMNIYSSIAMTARLFQPTIPYNMLNENIGI